MIVALMSTYREGALALAAARSALAACDALFVLEGAVGDPAPGGAETPLHEIAKLGNEDNCVCVDGEPVFSYLSDAEKRTALLNWAKEVCGSGGQQWWGIWIDGDELLLWGEHLPAYITSAEGQGAHGLPLRLVEFDGSVAFAPCRVFRGDLVRACVEGAYIVEHTNGMVVARPNEKICDAGGVPWKQGGDGVVLADLARLRPPLAGEPHLLHRSLLRDPERTARRIHHDENALYERGY